MKINKISYNYGDLFQTVNRIATIERMDTSGELIVNIIITTQIRGRNQSELIVIDKNSIFDKIEKMVEAYRSTDLSSIPFEGKGTIIGYSPHMMVYFQDGSEIELPYYEELISDENYNYFGEDIIEKTDRLVIELLKKELTQEPFKLNDAFIKGVMKEKRI